MWVQPGQHASLPCVYWTHAVDESAAVIREAGIDRLCVPPELAQAWRAAGSTRCRSAPRTLAARETLPAPGIEQRADLVSATRSPWVNANGWRFLRAPAGRYSVRAAARARRALAAAEAFAYGADAVLEDRSPPTSRSSARMLAFLRAAPALRRADAALADLGRRRRRVARRSAR